MMVTRGDGGTWGQGDMVTLGNGDRDKGDDGGMGSRGDTWAQRWGQWE